MYSYMFFSFNIYLLHHSSLSHTLSILSISLSIYIYQCSWHPLKKTWYPAQRKLIGAATSKGPFDACAREKDGGSNLLALFLSEDHSPCNNDVDNMEIANRKSDKNIYDNNNAADSDNLLRLSLPIGWNWIGPWAIDRYEEKQHGCVFGGGGQQMCYILTLFFMVNVVNAHRLFDPIHAFI
jgi:hypothetical protein